MTRHRDGSRSITCEDCGQAWEGPPRELWALGWQSLRGGLRWVCMFCAHARERTAAAMRRTVWCPVCEFESRPLPVEFRPGLVLDACGRCYRYYDQQAAVEAAAALEEARLEAAARHREAYVNAYAQIARDLARVEIRDDGVTVLDGRVIGQLLEVPPQA